MSSCLNLKVVPSKKAWKSFTKKLQTKLHSLTYKSISIKKKHQHHHHHHHHHHRRHVLHKHRPAALRINRTTAEAKQRSRWVLSPQQLLFKNGDDRRSSTGHHPQYRSSQLFKKKYKSAPTPVYIDKLFMEPTYKIPVTNKLMFGSPTGAEGTSCTNVGDQHRGEDGDEMWASMGFASPQMDGIDERAELFIRSFRADMRLQESLLPPS